MGFLCPERFCFVQSPIQIRNVLCEKSWPTNQIYNLDVSVWNYTVQESSDFEKLLGNQSEEAQALHLIFII